jgi:hypothetical protein
MIATKTTTLLVTMAVLGIVPVAAHAQPIIIEDLIAAEGTATQDSAPQQDADAVVIDDDQNTNTPVNFVIVSQGAFSTSSPTITAPFIASDTDTNTAAVSASQSAPLTLTPTQTASGMQAPTANPMDLLSLLPGSG